LCGGQRDETPALRSGEYACDRCDKLRQSQCDDNWIVDCV